MSPTRFVGIRDLREMLAPYQMTPDQFKRLGDQGTAPQVAIYVGPRMPRWRRADLEKFIADLETKALEVAS